MPLSTIFQWTSVGGTPFFDLLNCRTLSNGQLLFGGILSYNSFKRPKQ